MRPQATRVADQCELKEKDDQQMQEERRKIGEILRQLHGITAVVEETQTAIKIIHTTVALNAIQEMRKIWFANKRQKASDSEN